MITQAFLVLLLDSLAETIPAGQDREAGLTIARTLLEALHPADAKEAAQAARAIAAHFAAMDGFARAAKPGMSDETVIKLRGNALAASRLSDALVRPRQQPRPTRTPKTSRSGPAPPTLRCRHRRSATAPSCRCRSPACLTRWSGRRGARLGAARPLSRLCRRQSPCPAERSPVIASEAKQSACGLPRRSAPRTDSAISIAMGLRLARRTRYRPRMDKDVPRAHHDMGGVSKFMCEPVDIEPHALTDFDKEVDALRQVLGMKRVMTVDELRRGIEAIPEAEYHRLTYYRRWIRSITDNLLVKGVITEAELRAALERV